MRQGCPSGEAAGPGFSLTAALWLRAGVPGAAWPAVSARPSLRGRGTWRRPRRAPSVGGPEAGVVQVTGRPTSWWRDPEAGLANGVLARARPGSRSYPVVDETMSAAWALGGPGVPGVRFTMSAAFREPLSGAIGYDLSGRCGSGGIKRDRGAAARGDCAVVALPASWIPARVSL